MKYSFCIAILLSFVILFSCNKADPTAKTQEYLIKADSIQLPDSVAVGERFEIQFFGTVGNDGCHSFADFLASEDSTSLSLMLKGHKKVSANQLCPEKLVLLDGKVYSHKFSADGKYLIKVVNPGLGQFIQKEILVVEP